MMSRNLATKWSVLAALAIGGEAWRGGTAVGDEWPPVDYVFDLRGPTKAEHDRWLTQQALLALPGAACGFGWATVPLPVIVTYRNVPAACGPAHRSLRGTYGEFHPGPYYIPNLPPPVANPYTRAYHRPRTVYGDGRALTIERDLSAPPPAR